MTISFSGSFVANPQGVVGLARDAGPQDDPVRFGVPRGDALGETVLRQGRGAEQRLRLSLVYTDAARDRGAGPDRDPVASEYLRKSSRLT